MIIVDRTDFDLYTETVSALTRAALQSNPDGSPSDFSDFLARALAATAANVGGPHCLIAGRPGSWESSCVDGLVRGAAGNEHDESWFRSQPIVVRLNVAELIEDGQRHPGLMGLDEALESLGGRYESPASREQDLDAWDREIDMITDRYITEYRLYAERFTLAAQAIADHIPSLSAEIFVEADTDPNSTWWSTMVTNNPSELGSGRLAMAIWRAAHDVTPLPNVDIWLGASQPTVARE